MQGMAHTTKVPAAHRAAHSKTPSSRLRLARGCAPPPEGLRFVRGGAPPSSEVRLARGSAPLSNGVRLARGHPAHACACPRAQALNALTSAGRRHHAPGARAPVPPHQLPRRDPIPITVGGGDCATRPVPAPLRRAPTPVRLTRRALEEGPAAPSIYFLVTLQG
jgi:hypothetical protein